MQVILTLSATSQSHPRTLLADTGAGSRAGPFELILDEADCLRCGGLPRLSIILRGAYTGIFQIYDIDVQVPALGFAQRLRAVGVPSVPRRFDGIAGFRFLNRFTYGNFGDPGQFGLEC
ncbi:MAG: hypothetical protein ACRELG_10440 [Gemmataceae bacterium]